MAASVALEPEVVREDHPVGPGSGGGEGDLVLAAEHTGHSPEEGHAGCPRKCSRAGAGVVG